MPEKEDPPPTPIDRDCAFFVRDALFPLRRDWGSGGRGNHHQIHPALMALDRLRTDLIDLRPRSTSFSNIFPRGVLLVSRSDALTGTNSSGSNTSNKTTTSSMEYNGQPDVEESNASVEVIPNLLTVKCMRCNGVPFFPGASKAFVREKYKSWKNPEDDDYESTKEHELVVCSDRVLQKDYHRQFGNENRRQQHQREDLPIQSMGAVEEALAREITKLRVNGDGSTDTTTKKAKPPVSYPSFSAPEDTAQAAAASCEAFAKLELLAARAAECLLVSKQDEASGRTTETRMGSVLAPKPVFSMLPKALQRNFVDRCTLQVATRHTVAAAKEAASPNQNGNKAPLRPRDCVQTAWATHKKTISP